MTASPWARAIRARRKALGISQAELAEAAGVSLRTVHNIETKGRVPKVDTLAAVAHALGGQLTLELTQHGANMVNYD